MLHRYATGTYFCRCLSQTSPGVGGRKSQRVKLPFLSGDGFPYPTPLFPPGPTNLSCQPQVRVVLQNVTATINMRISVDVSSLANKVRNAEYNPKKLPAVVSEMSGFLCCCFRRH